MVKPTGFREYDARLPIEKQINFTRMQALALGLAGLLDALVAPVPLRNRPAAGAAASR
jgi:hypothetical protein